MLYAMDYSVLHNKTKIQHLQMYRPIIFNDMIYLAEKLTNIVNLHRAGKLAWEEIECPTPIVIHS